MGSGSSIVSQELLSNLLLNYRDLIQIQSASFWGMNEFQSRLWFIKFESNKLNPGENGHLDIITESYYDLKFKNDCDV